LWHPGLLERCPRDITFVTSEYVILDEIVKAVLEPVKYKPKMVPAEILLVALAITVHCALPEVPISDLQGRDGETGVYVEQYAHQLCKQKD
jgi:hypothetical protein